MDTTAAAAPAPPELFKCSGCMRVPRPAECFMGKSGKQVKTCNECRAKDAKQAKKPETRERKNAFQRGKGYDTKYRTKRREEDEEGFLAHNAQLMAAYRSNPANRERINKNHKMSVSNRLGSIKHQAAKKGNAWELTEEQEIALVMGLCFYCDSTTQDARNGIDRMDSKGMYTPSNCVSCCSECNRMKGSLDALTFVERCGQVSMHNSAPGSYTAAWKDSRANSYVAYTRGAAVKNVSFELSEREYSELVDGECTYCGRGNTTSHMNGINRLDYTKGYAMDNCVTSCGQCSHAKKTMSSKAFVDKCKAVAARLDTLVQNIPEMPRSLSVMSK